MKYVLPIAVDVVRIIRSAESAGPAASASAIPTPSPSMSVIAALMLDRTDRESSPERPVLNVAEVYRLADAFGPRHRH